LLNGKYVLAARPANRFPAGCISLSEVQRTWLNAGIMDTITTEIYDPFSESSDFLLGTVELEVSFASVKKTIDVPIDQDELERFFLGTFDGQFLTVGQKIIMDFKSVPLTFLVKACSIVPMVSTDTKSESSTVDKGLLNKQTHLAFYKDAKSTIKLKGSPKRPSPNSLVSPNFKFEDMGIGGLDDEFSQIFRRAFASRVFPPDLIERLGIQHVKGILLYGPPGTGKTLMARQIGKMLNAREPKIINGPEVLNKFVGQSEENIRKLFADAEKEYKEKGDESLLHIIIFDELDAVCKQRGSGTGGGTGVGDSIVNQLLSKLDGVEQLNNILLIGMTNRMDMIDDALLRPGRLEVHLEITLPDETGRLQILKIHLAKMRESNAIGGDVDISELAHRAKNFSGAELAGLVKSATSWAFNRHIKVGSIASIDDDISDLKVTRADFLKALDEVHPAFGVSEDALREAKRNDIHHFSPFIRDILEDGQAQAGLCTSARTSLASILLHGPPGAGKTALAAEIAVRSGFPFVKFISAHDMIGFSESMKIQHLNKAFSDAYKSPQNVVIIDDIERIVEWVRIGPRFSNGVLQALMVFVKKQPPAVSQCRTSPPQTCQLMSHRGGHSSLSAQHPSILLCANLNSPSSSTVQFLCQMSTLMKNLRGPYV
jgi:vesicle-fusing ATPase